MFSFFSKNKKVLGLDISEGYVRYSLVFRNKKEIKLLSYGEERVADVEPKNGLLFALSNIRRKTKMREAVVSLPNDVARFEEISIPKVSSGKVLSAIKFHLAEKGLSSVEDSILFYEKIEEMGGISFYKVLISSNNNISFLKSVFTNSGFRSVRFVRHRDALLNSCVKGGLLSSAMVVNIEESHTNIALYKPFEFTEEMFFKTKKNAVGSIVKDVYVDFYKENKEKIEYIFISGSLASNFSYISHLSKETGLSLEEANVFTNFNLDSNYVPSITKEESFYYAVAIGLCLS